MKSDGRFEKGLTPWNKGMRGQYSEDYRRKIREARARQVFPPGYSEMMSRACKGKKVSEETKQRISEARKRKFREQGFLNTPETRAKMSAALLTSEKHQRATHNPERIEKIRLRLIGRPCSEETREQIRSRMIGKPRPEEARRNATIALRAIPPERRAISTLKMLDTQRRNRPKNRTSKIETALLNAIERTFKMPIERQFRLETKLYDGRCGDILIEVDGAMWHDKPEQVKRDKVKDDLATKHGFLLIRIRVNRGDKVKSLLEKMTGRLTLAFSKRTGE